MLKRKNYRLKKMHLFITAIMLYACINVNAQEQNISKNHKIDNLESVYTTLKSDTSKANILLALADEYANLNQNKALQLINKALEIAIKSNYSIGIADSYSKKARIYILTGKLDSAGILNNKALLIYKELNNNSGILNCYSNLSVLEYYKGNNIKSIKYSRKALIYAKKTKNSKKTVKIYNNLGLMYSNKGMFDSAIVFAFESLKISEIISDSININSCYINIGGYYLQMDDSINTVKYLDKGIKLSKEINDKRGLCICYSNLAGFYMKYNQLDTALKLLTINIETDKELNDLYGLAIDIKTVASILKMQGKYIEAINKLSECSEIQNKMGNSHGLMFTNYQLADIYFLQKDYSRAKLYGEKALATSEKLQEKDSERIYLKLLSNIYFHSNNNKKAFLYLQESNEIKDSLFNISKHKQIEELEIKYQTAKNTQENLTLKYKNQIQKSELDYNKKALLFFIILFIIVGMFSTFILLELRKKNSAYKTLIVKNKELQKREMELLELKRNTKEQFSQIEKHKKYSDDKKEELLTKIEYELNHNKIYKKDINLKDLASLLNTNTTYLSDIINSCYNKTFSEYINNFRIQEVIKMMKKEEYQKYTLSAIGEMAGFSSEKTFSRVFKRVTGLSPSFYRKNIKNA